ncbi:hypothetical protein Lxx23845 [Leifsonia xyli subsp. xyli str. CTCB07]|uniref:IrrE N-terminal-like domain-containing protein n=2 Tax=Leifsonia xyli TaxID=1575 RepID=Q6AC70_LEIXX|nr:hypothetical protein Lxx23845 [Leifsonia xyli subsp. xyli str. CTCB07]
MGIEIIHRPLRTKNALWLPDRNLIVVKERMRSVHTRCSIAHELGHVHYGHVDDRPKHEVQADRFAAENLIDFAEIRDHLGWIGHPQLLAAELGVTHRLLRTYINVHRLAS